MGLNSTPSADRVHIGIFGRRNAGKSSVINGITGQSLAIVSDVKGTTTDPVSKAMELLPLGPVVMIDTPGIDDEGELGALRVQKSYLILNKTDIAVLVVDASLGMTSQDYALVKKIEEKQIAYVVVFNKSESLSEDEINKLCLGRPNDHRGHGVRGDALLVLLQNHLVGITQGGEKASAVLEDSQQRLVLADHVHLGPLAGRNVHVGTHAADGAHRLLDGLGGVLLLLEIPVVPVKRPLGHHDGLLFLLEVTENLLRDKGHKGMEKL